MRSVHNSILQLEKKKPESSGRLSNWPQITQSVHTRPHALLCDTCDTLLPQLLGAAQEVLDFLLHSGCSPTLPSLHFPFRSPSREEGVSLLRPDVWGPSSSYKLPVPSLPELLTAGAYLTPQTGQPLVSPDKGQEILDHHPLEVTPSTMGTELQRGRGSSSGARAQQGAGGGAAMSTAAALAAKHGWEQRGLLSSRAWVPNPPSQEPVLFPSLGLSWRSPSTTGGGGASHYRLYGGALRTEWDHRCESALETKEMGGPVASSSTARGTG